MKTLNLGLADNVGCRVTYNVNRFEVYHADGYLLTAAATKADLKAVLTQNRIKGAVFDAAARSKYLAALKEEANKVYVDNGYENRAAYLQSLAEDWGIELVTVQILADVLGPNEDFDGLVSSLKEMEL